MRKNDNQGFTLIEVLLSITIIAILFLSVLQAFTNTAKVSNIAQKQQDASITAQNIMENLKTMSLEDAAIQYMKAGYPEGVISSGHHFTKFDTASVKKLVNGGITTYTFDPPPGRDIYSFAITNLTENGVAYDALVTLDTATYSDASKYTNTMNNYQMPKLLTINENVVAILDMENLQATTAYDNEALSYFKSFHAAYVNAVEAQPTPIPPHTHVADATIDASTTKNIIMTLAKDTIKNENDITSYLKYTCSVDLNDDHVVDTFDSDEIYTGAYTIPTDTSQGSNIYLFYTPSSFAKLDASRRDTITIINKDAIKANIYIAYQTSNSTTTPVNIKKLTATGEDTTDNIKVFTNFQGTINSSTISAGKLYDKTTSNYRIYKITIEIYPKGAISNNDFSSPYLTLTSVKEE